MKALAPQDGANAIPALLLDVADFIRRLDTGHERARPPELAISLLCETRGLLELTRARNGQFLAQPVLAELDRVIAALPLRPPGDERFEFSANWVFPHEERWLELLAPLKGQPGLMFLELGSWEGRSACWLLEHILTHPTSRLVCADLFTRREDIFDRNIAATGRETQVKKAKGRIHSTLPLLPKSSMHFIYVDASSNEKDELEDARLSWELLRPGGLIVFDDYGGPPDWEPGVTKGVQSFLRQKSGELEILFEDFQLGARKT